MKLEEGVRRKAALRNQLFLNWCVKMNVKATHNKNFSVRLRGGTICGSF